jgi:hypothetical protein
VGVDGTAVAAAVGVGVDGTAVAAAGDVGIDGAAVAAAGGIITSVIMGMCSCKSARASGLAKASPASISAKAAPTS